MVGRREAPCVVRGASDEDVHRHPRDGGTLGFDPGAAEVDLLHDLRVVVAELWPHHGEAVPRRRTATSDDLEVRCLLARHRARRRVGAGILDAERASAAGSRRTGIERHDRTLVDGHGAGDGAAGEDRVLEVAFGRGRGLRVVEEHGVLPRGSATFGTEGVLERGEELGVRGFGTTAGPEDRPDECGDGDDVVDGHGRLLDALGGPVRVHTVRLGLGIGDDLAALVAIGGLDQADLIGHQLLCFRAGHERLATGHETEGVDPRDVGDRDPSGTSTQLQEEPTVACRDPAGAEGHVGSRLAVDVGDAVVVVEDRQPGPAGGFLWGRPHRFEVLGEEKRSMSPSVTSPRSGVSRVVERQLVAGLVRGRQAAVVAGREDVAGAILGLSVGPVCAGWRGDGGGGDRGQDGERNATTWTSHGSPRFGSRT